MVKASRTAPPDLPQDPPGCPNYAGYNDPSPAEAGLFFGRLSLLVWFSLSSSQDNERGKNHLYSKKLEYHAAAVSLYVAYYNMCRVHEALRTTPAVALEIADHVWSIGELIDAVLTAVPPRPIPPPIFSVYAESNFRCAQEPRIAGALFGSLTTMPAG